MPANNFWTQLKKPFLALAPLANVTDAAFRRLIAKYGGFTRPDGSRGGPDVMWTEFVSADGLCHPVGRERLLIDLQFSEAERPIVAQLFTAHPDKMFVAAQLVAKLGFDGLDINMGCPDQTIEKQGAGAALIKNPKQAQVVIAAAKAGAPSLPVSVKTRIGYNRDELESWLPVLLESDLAAITIHARTRKEMSKVPAHWEAVARAVKIRNQAGVSTLIIGNGDVKTVVEAYARAEETGADGIMLGRAIFGNPWLFANRKTIACSRTERGIRDQSSPSSSTVEIVERLRVMLEHTKLFVEIFGDHKSFAVMKKHYKAYVDGFPGAKELREKLMTASNYNEVKGPTNDYLTEHHISV